MVRGLAERLAQVGRVLVVDGPGHGESDVPAAPFTMEACADAARAVLEAFGVARSIVIGSSWGGIVGVYLALRHPTSVDRLVLLNVPFDMPKGARALSSHMIVMLTKLLAPGRFFARGVARSMFASRTWREQPEVVEAFVAALGKAKRVGLVRAGRSVLIDRRSVLPLLPELRVPVLVVAGEEDGLYAAASLERAAAVIQGARFELVPRTGHLTAMEAPQATAELVREWLSATQPR
jgi:pimeloyl-ACP methyl ester carboxylesterase